MTSIPSDRHVLYQGQCCDCIYDDGRLRLWICRVAGGKTVEEYNETTGRWEKTQGGCYPEEEDDA